MTGGLVSITELRARAESVRLDGIEVSPPTVLALVEAVEAAKKAAQREAEGCPHRSASQCSACEMEIYDARMAADQHLAKFSFEAAAGAGDNR